ncbi:MAG: hypothetical protein IKD69_08375 [Solobacterium sp.]|nr:hypothetical protein [Solobacterium sp.]
MIGRQQEIKNLNRLYNSGRSELVAIYGRQRVGKTYLVEETFKGRITFRHAGISPADMEERGKLKAQLKAFYNSLTEQGMEPGEIPQTWMDAFFLLEMYLKKKDDGSRQLVFLDELPWLDSPRSGFLSAFEGFWNIWACHRDHLMVIVCGSANSWILNKMINNHGGLYGRVTYEIKLSPFTLRECEEFYRSRNVSISRYDIVQSYMIFGGIPYYMNYVREDMSFAQSVDRVFFSRNALLQFEFDRLFDSVFTNPARIKSIVRFLYTKNAGYTRKEISEKTKIPEGGTLTESLHALLSSGFIIRYVPFGLKKNEEHFKLTDPFCLFYLHFMESRVRTNENFWQQNMTEQSVVSWRGFAFENVCFNHIDQIKRALGISGVITSSSAWSKKGGDEEGTQIDLLLIRNDNVINMCEIRFTNDEFTVDKSYYRTLLSRPEKVMKLVSRKTSIHSTLITTFGLKHNEYSGVFTNVITLDDLFS